MKALIVDDDKFILDLYEREFKLAQHEPRLAHDGLEAMEIMTNARFIPDVIVTSLDMARMDGFELIGRLKSDDKLKGIPVVVLTNRFDRESRERALELGASIYLIKSEHTANEVLRQAATLTNQ